MTTPYEKKPQNNRMTKGDNTDTRARCGRSVVTGGSLPHKTSHLFSWCEAGGGSLGGVYEGGGGSGQM